MSAEVLEKANVLAEAIANSIELASMRAAEYRMSKDPEAVKIIEEFQNKQQEIYDIQASGQELSEELKKEVAQIEERMNQNASIKTYIQTSEKFEELLKNINMIITEAISGPPQESCGCSACGTDCNECN